MIKTNFHTHTFRCGHAIGDEEAMVKSAIKNNIEILGMCCHIPLPKYRWHLLKGMHCTLKDPRSFASWCRTMIYNGPAMRMPYRMKALHERKVKELKERHKDVITIIQGYEAEYLPEYLDYYQMLLDSGQAEYLILGNHFDTYSVHTRYYGRLDITNQDIKKYKEDVIKAFDTGLFSYFAHPDLFMVGKKHWDSFCEEISWEICLKAKETNTPLEVNGGGMRRGLREIDGELIYPYPNTHFWQIVAEVGNDVVFGLDAHKPDDINNGIYEELKQFADKHHLHVIDTFDFKKGNRGK